METWSCSFGHIHANLNDKHTVSWSQLTINNVDMSLYHSCGFHFLLFQLMSPLTRFYHRNDQNFSLVGQFIKQNFKGITICCLSVCLSTSLPSHATYCVYIYAICKYIFNSLHLILFFIVFISYKKSALYTVLFAENQGERSLKHFNIVPINRSC